MSAEDEDLVEHWAPEGEAVEPAAGGGPVQATDWEETDLAAFGEEDPAAAEGVPPADTAEAGECDEDAWWGCGGGEAEEPAAAAGAGRGDGDAADNDEFAGGEDGAAGAGGEVDAGGGTDDGEDLAADCGDFGEDGEDEFAAINLEYESVNAENSQDGRPEERLLARIRQEMRAANILPSPRFHLEPFGSYVTDLGLPNAEDTAKSDLDVVLLFHDWQADSVEVKDVRPQLVAPTITRLGSWLARQPGVTIKNVIHRARVPIVTFETKDLDVDISVQQPYGCLNSWHLRDLCESGWPGRLKALARSIKIWAKTKSIHTSKDGCLSSYGWVMLAAAFLQDVGGLAALLPLQLDRPSGPYLDADEALGAVLQACEGLEGWEVRRPDQLWHQPCAYDPAEAECEEAQMAPSDLFHAWLRWMSDTVLGFLKTHSGASGGIGRVPLESRYIVSVRDRTQEDLQADTTWSPKRREHWDPRSGDVFLTIEEPLNGENVARCVRLEGLYAIEKEVTRALDFLAGKRGGASQFKALLKLPALRQAGNGQGKGGGRPWGNGGPPGGGWGAKRGRDDAGTQAVAPPAKRVQMANMSAVLRGGRPAAPWVGAGRPSGNAVTPPAAIGGYPQQGQAPWQGGGSYGNAGGGNGYGYGNGGGRPQQHMRGEAQVSAPHGYQSRGSPPVHGSRHSHGGGGGARRH